MNRVQRAARLARRGLAVIGLDLFILAILGAVALAAVLPARGGAHSAVEIGTMVGIALLFFLYGMRLSPGETLAGLKHWRLHLTVLTITFIAFPLLGLAAQWILSPVLGAGLAAGILYLTLAPSTVQSSISFVSISRGNVAGAIVSASASNLLGVFLTPLLAIALMATASGIHIDASSVGKIAAQLLAPFVLGQILRPVLWPRIKALGPRVSIFDKAVIVLVVYSAFSQASAEGLFSTLSWGSAMIVLLGCIVLLACSLGLSALLGKIFGFAVADQRVIQFCGSKKSLATGMPMAAVLFAGQPIGLVVLPLMIFHQVQLIACAWLAGHYARKTNQSV